MRKFRIGLALFALPFLTLTACSTAPGSKRGIATQTDVREVLAQIEAKLPVGKYSGKRVDIESRQVTTEPCEVTVESSPGNSIYSVNVGYVPLYKNARFEGVRFAYAPAREDETTAKANVGYLSLTVEPKRTDPTDKYSVWSLTVSLDKGDGVYSVKALDSTDDAFRHGFECAFR